MRLNFHLSGRGFLFVGNDGASSTAGNSPGLHEQLVPWLHQERQHERHGPRRDGEDIHLAHAVDNRMQHQRPRGGVQALDEGAPGAADGGLDVRRRDAGQDLGDGGGGVVEEDGVCDGEGDGGAGDLAGGDEADDGGDVLRGDLGLGDGEGGLDEGAAAEAEEDGVAVDGGRAGVLVDGVHERGADEVEHAGDDVPGEVVARGAHDGAVGDAGDDEQDDEGEEAHAGFEGGVRVHELEEERDEVDGDEGGGAGGGGFGEEDQHDFAAEELDGEDAAFGRGEESEALLDTKDGEEDAGAL